MDPINEPSTMPTFIVVILFYKLGLSSAKLRFETSERMFLRFNDNIFSDEEDSLI